MVMVFSGFRKILQLLLHKMSSPSSVSLSPIGVRGMKVLQREKFLRNIRIPILKLNEDKLAKIMPLCKPLLLKLENFKPVQDFQNESFKKCIHLNPEKIEQFTDIPEDIRSSFNQLGIYDKNFATKEVQFGYENWKFDDIFKAVLPENEEIVSSFSQIGHIIHLNLREHLLDYRLLIGQVLVDKIKTCRTVVNKSNTIDNTFRNFSMEVIAGDKDFLVTVKENRCNFQFDFSQVYWNPRLCKEHERILNLLHSGDVLFDVFCGVGPFSIPAAKRKSKVFANDLNPDSFKWLNHNAKSNKINMSMLKSFNLDGKDFICNIFREYLIEYCKGNEKLEEAAKIHVTMNLPAMAVEFLKYFNGLIKDPELISKLDREIIVHVYCFAVGDKPSSVAAELVNKNIGCNISKLVIDIFDVRNVSPKKEMMRVTFNLTKDIILGFINSDTDSEPPVKKICVDSGT